MISTRPSDETLRELLDAACSDALTDEQFEQLETALADSEDARREYLRYFTLGGELRYLVSMAQADATARRRTDVEFDAAIPLREAGSFIPPPTSPLQAVATGLSQDWTRAYVFAAVVLGLFLMFASWLNVTHFAGPNRAEPTARNILPPPVKFVGRISGVKDCVWSDPNAQTIVGASVSLDRQYALASGLLEITYKSGAKVILEGPCTYKVDSFAGGFLERGKLTANIRGQRSPNPQPLIPNPFVVRTPTAVVTDLGTEFGVEVAENGDTTSYVFQGTVRVEAMGGVGSASVAPEKIHAGESVRVTRDAADAVRFTHPAMTPKFVRSLFKPLKTIDLLDVITGGDGTGGRRERGLDPATGMEDTFFVPEHRGGDQQFHIVDWHRMIDGVFVPDGAAGAIKIDSAGHVFDGFPDTTGDAFGSIWPRSAKPRAHDDSFDRSHKQWIYAMGQGKQFMPQGRGLLCLHPNAGVTFDLAAIRRVFRDAAPSRFQAIAGVADASRLNPNADGGKADFWVFVDGRPVLQRTGHRPKDGSFKVDVELKPGDRFLTLAVTDGGNTADSDWSVFGDPVLIMKDNLTEERPMEQ